MTPSEQSNTTDRPSFRARQYGKHRSRGHNIRAYLWADAYGRELLRDLARVRYAMARRVWKDRRS